MEKLKVISSCCFLSCLLHSPLPSLTLPASYFYVKRIVGFFFSFCLFFIMSDYISWLQDFGHISLLSHYVFIILSPNITVQSRARQRIQAAQVCFDAWALVGVNEQRYLWPLLAFEQTDAICFPSLLSLNTPPPSGNWMSCHSRLMPCENVNTISCSL